MRLYYQIKLIQIMNSSSSSSSPSFSSSPPPSSSSPSSSSSPFPVYRQGRRFSSASQSDLYLGSLLWADIWFWLHNFTSGCPSHSTFAISLARDILDWSTPCFLQPDFFEFFFFDKGRFFGVRW
jgi:hypothetical protein